MLVVRGVLFGDCLRRSMSMEQVGAEICFRYFFFFFKSNKRAAWCIFISFLTSK